jgi:ERI1 exoribonuclease 3
MTAHLKSCNIFCLLTPLIKNEIKSLLHAHIRQRKSSPCGNWDLKTMLPMQCAAGGTHVPPHFHQWINLNKLIPRQFKKSRAIVSHMGGLLSLYGLHVIGRPHSGIDDCRNIARVCQKFAQAGGRFEVTSKKYPEC